MNEVEKNADQPVEDKAHVTKRSPTFRPRANVAYGHPRIAGKGDIARWNDVGYFRACFAGLKMLEGEASHIPSAKADEKEEKKVSGWPHLPEWIRSP